MGVDAPQISIDPYKSQVPLIQIPSEDLQRAQPMPEQAGYMGKAGAGLAIGDSLMKGVLKGLQMKEQKKYAQATATINALDTTTNSAYENYQTLLAQGKQDEAKAAYDVYLKNFNDAKAAKAQFAIPDKGAQKGQKQKGKKDQKDANGVAVQGGFGAGLKQFFERNPHVIPELALVAMQPKPPGPSVDTLQNQSVLKQQQQAAEIGDIKLQEAKKKQAAEDTYAAGVPTFQGLSSEQVAALPPDVKKNYDAWESAKAYLTPMKHSMAMATYKMPDGTFQRGYADDPPADGELYVPGATPKIGTESEFTANALKGYGVTEKTPPAQKAALEKYIHDVWQQRAAQTTSGTHEQLVPDPVTGKMVAVRLGSSTTKGASQPKPPAGFAPLDENGMPIQGGMQAPPQQSAPAAQTGGKTATAGKMTAPPSATPKTTAPKTAGKGAMTPPPTGVKGLRNTGLSAMAVATNTQKVETEKTTRYQKAEDAYRKALETNQKQFEKVAASLLKAGQWNDAAKKQQQTLLDQANAKAAADLEAAKGEIGKWYEQQVRAVGGTVGNGAPQGPPPGATMVYKDAQGNVKGYAVNGQFVAAGSQ